MAELVWRETSIDRDDFKIKVLSDNHVDSDGFKEDLYKRQIEYIVSNEDCYWFGNGDYIVGSFPGKRTYRPKDWPIDEAIDHAIRLGKKYGLVEAADRCLGFGCGNHDLWIAKRFGVNPITRLALELQVSSVFVSGMESFYRIRFGPHNKLARHRSSLTVYMHHGWSGGKYGAERNWEQLASNYPFADLFIVGHHHKRKGDVGEGCWMGWPPKFHPWTFYCSGMTEEGAEYAREKAYRPRRAGSDVVVVSRDKTSDKPNIGIMLGEFPGG